MSIPATPESIFTEAYWAPIPPETTYYRPDQGLVRRMVGAYREDRALTPTLYPARNIDEATKDAAQESLHLSISRMIEGLSGELIPPGEPIGGPADNSYVLPGAVLLVDKESITQMSPDSPSSIATNMNEAQLAMSAAGFFLSGLRKPSPGHENPFGLRRFLVAPVERNWMAEDGHAYYKRWTGLYAFCLNKKGCLASLGLSLWREIDGVPPIETALYYHPYPVTGGETANSLWSTKDQSYTRIREARVCLGGIKQYAPEKVREKSAFSLQQVIPVTRPPHRVPSPS